MPQSQSMLRTPAPVQAFNLEPTLGATPAIEIQWWSWGLLLCPGTLTSTTVTVHVCGTKDGTYKLLKNQDGSANTMTIATDDAVPFPSEMFAAKWMKLVTNADDSAQSFGVELKG